MNTIFYFELIIKFYSMRVFICLFSLLFTGTCLFAQTGSLNQGVTYAKNYYEEIPYEAINGKIFISVGLGGKVHRFLFDTGAPVMLSKELSDQVGAVVINTNSLTDAYGGKGTVTVVKANGLRLGQVGFDSVAALLGLPDLYKCWQIDGVMGSNVLRNSIVRIDPGKHVIILTDQEDRLQLDTTKSIPLITGIGSQSDPKIMVRFGGKTDLLLGFDTGDKAFLRISEDNMRALRKDNTCTIISKGYGSHQFSGTGAEKDADKYLLQAPTVSVGSGEFLHASFETGKNATPGIGAALLNYGTVTLDFLHHRFYFQPGAGSVDLEEKHWPLQPTIAGDKLLVGLVWSKGRPQLKPGQQIVAIDGVSYERVDFCEVINRSSLLGAGKVTATLSVRDEQGVVRQVEIRKED